MQFPITKISVPYSDKTARFCKHWEPVGLSKYFLICALSFRHANQKKLKGNSVEQSYENFLTLC